MEVLLEIHSEEELDHLNPFVDMLGVNNRNLGTFHTDAVSYTHLDVYKRQVSRKNSTSYFGTMSAALLLSIRLKG